MAAPNPDGLRYAQAQKWFPRTRVLTANAERAVQPADLVTEDCQIVKEVHVYALSGTVLASNREDGEFMSILEGTGFVFPFDRAENVVWVKGGTALIVTMGFSATRANG
jgi:hypothetical protein